MRRSRRVWAAALLAVGVGVVSPLSASAAPADALAPTVASSGLTAPLVRLDDYPSWDQVNAAKASEAAKQAEVTNITNLLSGLEAEAAALGDEAVKKGNEYLTAQSNLQAATQVSQMAEQRATDAEARADQTTKQVGEIAAQLYRSGGNQTAALLLSGDDADSLLYKLGTMSKLTEQSAQLNAMATASQNLASTLKQQADTAEAARATLATAAQQAAADAQAAQEAADAQVADQQEKSTVLYAQLASLQNTTAALEESYREGQAKAAAEAAQAAAAQAAADAAANSGGSGSSDGSGSSAGLPPGSVVVDTAAAKAYARTQMAPNGWGDDQYQCLLDLWTRESGWRVNAYNASSGSYGIPQSLPGSKMASAGSDWRTNAQTQINWGLSYISGRYDTPCGAWAHSQNTNPHWY